MRIESTVHRKGTSAVPSVKKKKKENKESNGSEQTESLELSEEVKLLNKLLHATSNQFTPYPFYFVNAAARNVKQACTISKNIQNQAESMGVLFNYTMIYDMVIDLANQNHHIPWTATISTEYEALGAGEKILFEKLHNACLKNQTPVSIIETAALRYVQFKQSSTTTRGTINPGKRDCAKVIVESLKEEPILNHNNVKTALSGIIKEYVTQTIQPEAV